MRRCLIIGRTSEDVAECKRYGLATHGAAMSTIYWNDYEMFDGDLITCHTIKYGAKWAVSVDPSQRTVDSAIAYPKQIVIGTSQLHHNITPELLNNAIVLHHNMNLRYPTADTGEFALWFANFERYDEIYTVGLDMRNDREKVARVKRMIDKFNARVYKANECSALPCPVKEPPTF